MNKLSTMSRDIVSDVPTHHNCGGTGIRTHDAPKDVAAGWLASAGPRRLEELGSADAELSP